MRERLWPAVIGSWLLTIVVLAIIARDQLSGMIFPDPDDAMRLLEVRDWLAGQSWWDVSQHRLNGGVFSMHWSRLVDLPIAAVLLVLDPLIGPALAHRAAGAIVPAGTLLAIMALAAVLTRRLGGTEAGRAAGLVVALAIPVMSQVQPMRLDHHGWQIVFALAAMLPLTAQPNARNGALCGLLLAIQISISLEGLPFAVAATGIAALAWASDPARRVFLLGHAWTLAGATALLHVATRGPGLMLPACDAVSPVWIAALVAGALGVSVATRARVSDWRGRIAILLLVGLACVGVIAWLQPQCLRGPFADLSPLVRNIWYNNISEGLPVWQQQSAVIAATLGLPAFGLLGMWRAWRTAAPEQRPAWLLLGAATLAATATACMVVRAGGVASAVATPGAVVLMLRILHRARALPRLLPRVVATAGALTLASPGIAVAALTSFETSRGQAQVDQVGRPICREFNDWGALASLPPATIFAPLDVSPRLIVATPHRAIAGGYHRNTDAIGRVISAFTAPPERAQQIVRASGAGYVAACPGLNETELYRAVAPDGLWARLERGESVAWLRPLPLPGSAVRVWRVIDSTEPDPAESTSTK